MRRIAALIAGLGMAAALVLPVVTAAPAHADNGNDINAFVGSINAVRASRGLGPLTLDTRLNSLASYWSAQLAAAGVLSHNPNLANMLPPGWTLGGENVGYGQSEPQLESMFENSPEHFANMVQPAYTAIGIGIVWTGTTMWVTEDFTAGVTPQPPAPTWTGWSAVPGANPGSGVVGGPAIASWGLNRFDQFVRGGDNHLWHRFSVDGGATFDAWENMGAPGGGLASSPAAVSWSADRVDVFVRGADNALWHLWWDGLRWNAWENLGGVLSSAPAVSSWAPGRLDVFVAGDNHVMYHKWYDHGWSGFESRGGVVAFDPAAASWSPGRIDLFAVSADHALYHSWWDGRSWSGWVNEVPGSFSSGPAVAAWGSGRLDVFASGAGAGQPMIHAWWSGAWYSESLFGNLTAAPSAASWHAVRLDTFVKGTDGTLYHKGYGF